MGGIEGGCIGSINGVSIGQILGGQIGSISKVLVHIGWFSLFMHTQVQRAQQADEKIITEATINKMIFLISFPPLLLLVFINLA